MQFKQTKQHGFTLVELVVVIAVLGILAATALPRFINVGTSARVASLNGLKGALQSAANMGAAMCRLDSACNPAADGGQFPNTVINGTTVYFHYGYPTGWGRFFIDNGVGGIQELVDVRASLISLIRVGLFKPFIPKTVPQTPTTADSFIKCHLAVRHHYSTSLSRLLVADSHYIARYTKLIGMTIRKR